MDGELIEEEVIIVPAGSVITIYRDFDALEVMPVTANGVECADGIVTVTEDTVILEIGGDPQPPVPDYTVNSVSALIPESGSFYAEASVTKNTSRSAKDVIVIAAYSSQGELIDYVYMRSAYAKGQTVEFGGRLKADGVAEVKAFVWDNLTDMKPLGNTKTVSK